MVTRVHPRIPHLGYAPLGVVGLMLSKISFHCSTPGDLSIFRLVCVPVVPDPYGNRWSSIVGGLIIRAWFADDDLEREKY